MACWSLVLLMVYVSVCCLSVCVITDTAVVVLQFLFRSPSHVCDSVHNTLFGFRLLRTIFNMFCLHWLQEDECTTQSVHPQTSSVLFGLSLKFPTPWFCSGKYRNSDYCLILSSGERLSTFKNKIRIDVECCDILRWCSTHFICKSYGLVKVSQE